MRWLVEKALVAPFIVVALAAGLLGLGLYCYSRLDIEAYPNPVAPMIEVITQPAGWSAEEVERYVTIPLENGLAGMIDLEHIRSQSLFGLSDVKCYFSWTPDYQTAQQRVLNRLQFINNLPPGIQPLRLDLVAVGRAMTVLEADFFEESTHSSHNPLAAKPFGIMLEALDDLKRNEIYLCTGASPRYACWGELMSVRAMKNGAAGAVIARCALGRAYGPKGGFWGLQATYPAANPVAAVFWPNASTSYGGVPTTLQSCQSLTMCASLSRDKAVIRRMSICNNHSYSDE